MNIADIWNIVWQGTPFHFAIAIILGLAIIYEILITVNYLSNKKTKQLKIPPTPRFVTTLCISIGVLGTFYGIQQSLEGRQAPHNP